MFQNYPNPFNPTTTISFWLPYTQFVNLSVYDITGRKVASLMNERMNTGSHQIIFDGERLSSGTNFYELKTKNGAKSRKMLLVK